MAGTFVKCNFKFDAEVDGDLSLEVGDVVHVTKVVSEDWYHGTMNGKSGQFPKSFVEETTEKPNEVFDVAIAVSAFTAEQDGDLGLNEGEVVIITDIIDENWAVGSTHGGHKGTFPRAFVKQISFEDDAMRHALQAAVPSFKEEIREADKEDIIEEDNSDDRYVVLEPFTAQGVTELNLVKGQTVEVVEVFDDFWLEGKSENGDTGMFPRTCIDFPEDRLPVTDDKDISHESSTQEVIQEEEKLDIVNDNQIQTEVEAADKISTDDLKFYVVAIFDYNSSVEGDLIFVTGDQIRVTKTIDENWYKGEFAGNIGVFPSNHVEPVDQSEINDDENSGSHLLRVPDETEDDVSDTESFPPPPSEDVLSDLDESYTADAVPPEEPAEAPTVDASNDKASNNKVVEEHKEKSKPPQTKKPPPSRPASKPKKPGKPNTTKEPDTDTVSVTSTEDPVSVEKPKPKKKAPPERPKMPALKKDTLPPFSYKFDTESQPTVIISGKYVKPGQPNVIILRKS